MRFLYADPALEGGHGPRADACRAVLNELSRRGIEAVVLAANTADVLVQSELSALPFFTPLDQIPVSEDPITRWLDSLYACASAFVQDFHGLSDVSAANILYLVVEQPAQLWGLTRWLASLNAGQAPFTLVEFETASGAEVNVDGGDLLLGVPDPSVDPRPTLFRFAAGLVRRGQVNRVMFVNATADVAQVYSALLDVDVGVLPRATDQKQVAQGLVEQALAMASPA